MIKVQQIDRDGKFVYPGSGCQRIKFYAYASGRVKYLCKNTDINASESLETWTIKKFTDASPPDIEGERTGAVNTEAVVNALGWNI